MLLQQITLLGYRTDTFDKLENGGTYKVFGTTRNSYLIKSFRTGKGIFVPKENAKEGKPMAMTYRDMGKCIKFLQLMKYKILLGHYDEKYANSHKIINKTVMENYFVNEFDFESAFCYMFRNHKVKDKSGKGIHICYCPMKPYEHELWPIVEDSYMGQDGSEISTKRKSCNHFVSKKTGKVKLRSFEKQLELTKSISVKDIVKHIKRIGLAKAKKKKLAGLWFCHIQQRVEEWELNNKKEFV